VTPNPERQRGIEFDDSSSPGAFSCRGFLLINGLSGILLVSHNHQSDARETTSTFSSILDQKTFLTFLRNS
jgi:hypothetical protein